MTDNNTAYGKSHRQSSIDHCRIISLPQHADPNGSLTEIENLADNSFKIKRVFYLYDVPANSERGGHSHHKAEEIIVAVSGSFDVIIDDGISTKRYHLDRPYSGLYIEKGIWRTLDNFSSCSVCLVLTTEEYDEADYVRDYNEFKKLTSAKHCAVAQKRYQFLDMAKCDKPYLDEIKQAVNRVIESGRYIGGKEVEDLEDNLCRLTSAPYAIGVSNGLDALRLILRGYIELGRLKAGDEIIVPANTYIASILAVTDCQLTPIFVEPSLQTLNLDTQLIEKVITPRTKAIMTVHLYGRVCWDETLAKLAKEHSLLVIEDNAQAIAAKSDYEGLHGSYVSGALGDAAAFSFYPTKNIGAMGDAGAVVTHDKQLADAVRALRNYGSDRRYHNIYAGYNCRLDPMQAAIINVKLQHIDDEIKHRQLLASTYNNHINNPLITLPAYSDNCVWHQYVIMVDDRDKFRKYLLDNGVETDVHYATPPHQQPCYKQYSHLQLPVTMLIANSVVSLPISRCTSVNDAIEISQIINGYK